MTEMAPGDKNLSNKLNKLTEIKVARGNVAGKLKNEIRSNRRDPKLRIKLANHYINKADYVRTLAVLKKGTADFPNKEDIRRLYANTLHRTGKEKEALEQYILLATSNPDIVEAVNNLAFSQLNKGLLTEATANFNTTLNREPNNFRGRLGLAMVYSKLEENNKAEAECMKILDQAKDYAPAMNRLAWIYAKQGIKLNKAEALSKKSLAIFDNIPEYIDTLSEINYKKGNHDEAIRLIKRAVKLIPSDSYYKRQLFKFRRAKGQG
jgi:tetratricopeptide (TPR) repeat protein